MKSPEVVGTSGDDIFLSGLFYERAIVKMLTL